MYVYTYGSGSVSHQALLPMGFSRQEYWSGLPSPSPGDFMCVYIYIYICICIYQTLFYDSFMRCQVMDV